MSRPTNTPPQGPKFSISIPVGWYAIVTAISRKTYNQGVAVDFDIFDAQTRVFSSNQGSRNDLMKVTLNQATSLPFIVQEDDYDLDFTFYHSQTEVKDAQVLVNNDSFSSNINVLKTEKPPRSVGPDCVTFFVFVEDTPSQESNTGRFDDGVAMIHVVRKDKK